MTDITSMFQSIKESLNSERKNRTTSKDFIRLEDPKTYLGRLVPYTKDPAKTFFHYYNHGWTSLATNQYVSAICLRTFEDRCPICEACFKLYRTKKPEDKALANMIRQREQHLVNIYVIEDPTTKENVGQVKILRFGKKLYSKILDATEGSDANEFGARIYDLSENGCNFKIRVEKIDDYPNYDNSRFTSPAVIPDMTPSKMKEVLDSVFDLSTKIDVKTPDELQSLVDTHLFCVNMDKLTKSATKETENKTTEKPRTMSTGIEQPKEQKTEKAPVTDEHNEKIKNMLRDLDSL